MTEYQTIGSSSFSKALALPFPEVSNLLRRKRYWTMGFFSRERKVRAVMTASSDALAKNKDAASNWSSVKQVSPPDMILTT